jgi:hypothetical protein
MRKRPRRIRDGRATNARTHGIWDKVLSPSEQRLWDQIAPDPGQRISDVLRMTHIQLRRALIAQRRQRQLPLVLIEEGGGLEVARKTRRLPDYHGIIIRLLRTQIRAIAVASLTGSITDATTMALRIKEALAEMDNSIEGPPDGLPVQAQVRNGHNLG